MISTVLYQKQFQVSFVVPLMDSLIPWQDTMNLIWGLPGNDVTSSEYRRNKYLMHTAIAKTAIDDKVKGKEKERENASEKEKEKKTSEKDEDVTMKDRLVANVLDKSPKEERKEKPSNKTQVLFYFNFLPPPSVPFFF